MASFVFDQAKELFLRQELNFTESTFKLALLKDDWIFSNPIHSTYTKWSDISSHEVEKGDGTITKYEPRVITNIKYDDVVDAGGPCDDGLKDYIFYADNITYNVSTITAYAIIIVKSTNSNTNVINGDDKLILAIDIRKNINNVLVPVTSNDGIFTIKLDRNSGGFLKIK